MCFFVLFIYLFFLKHTIASFRFASFSTFFHQSITKNHYIGVASVCKANRARNVEQSESSSFDIAHVKQGVSPNRISVFETVKV